MQLVYLYFLEKKSDYFAKYVLFFESLKNKPGGSCLRKTPWADKLTAGTARNVKYVGFYRTDKASWALRNSDQDARTNDH